MMRLASSDYLYPGSMNMNILRKTCAQSFLSASSKPKFNNYNNNPLIQLLRFSSSSPSTSSPPTLPPSLPSSLRPKSYRNARQDYGIASKFVQIVTPNNGSEPLPPPQLLKSVLRDIDQNTQTLVQVAEKSASCPHPVAIIMSKTQFRHLVKQEKEAAKNNRDHPENLFTSTQLTWGITQHDLTHKLKKCSTILSKGGSAEIDVRFKKGTRPPSQEDQIAFINGIIKAFGIPVIETKARAIMGGMTRLFFKGDLKKN